MKQKKQFIFDFLSKHELAVISTIDSRMKKPEAALVAFAETKDLEIVFQTQCDTRKYHNLRINREVALVVGWDPSYHVTLQYEGSAEELGGHELKQCLALFLAKDTPCTETFLANPKSKIFKVRPHWIAYSDYTKKVPEVFELHLDRI